MRPWTDEVRAERKRSHLPQLACADDGRLFTIAAQSVTDLCPWATRRTVGPIGAPAARPRLDPALAACTGLWRRSCWWSCGLVRAARRSRGWSVLARSDAGRRALVR